MGKKTGKPKGRPTKLAVGVYTEALLLASIGKTQSEIAEYLGVNIRTISNWLRRHPAFRRAIQAGKGLANARVERALFERAIGYSHPEDKIFLGKDNEPVIVPTIKHYPPETLAAMGWLKNKDPENWKDKQEIEHSGGQTVTIISYADYKQQLGEDSPPVQIPAKVLSDTTLASPGPWNQEGSCSLAPEGGEGQDPNQLGGEEDL